MRYGRRCAADSRHTLVDTRGPLPEANPMELTLRSIHEGGTLIVGQETPDGWDRVFLFRRYRFFFSVNGNSRSPEDLTTSERDGVPDFVLRMIHQLAVAERFFIETLGLRDFLREGTLYEQGARNIYVHLEDIPVAHGIASARVHRITSPLLGDDQEPHWGSLLLKLHRGLSKRTLTPVHELFHLFQFGYSQFNNIWMMEGLARLSQRFFQSHPPRSDPLPATLHDLNSLVNKWHDAESFWVRLSNHCRKGPLHISRNLQTSGLELNRDWNDGVFVRLFLEQLGDMPPLMRLEQPDRNLPLSSPWERLEKRNATNNRYIFRAICNAVDLVAPPSNPELDAFLQLIRPLAFDPTEPTFRSPAIQQLMHLLALLGTCPIRSAPTHMCCDYFDVPSGTLSVVALSVDGSVAETADFSGLRAVRNVTGDLNIHRARRLDSLDFLDHIEAVEGNLLMDDIGITSLHTLTCLQRVKGDITISNNQRLSRVSGLNSLTTIDRNLIIRNNPLMTHVTGFNSLERIKKGSLTIADCPNLITITGFHSLVQVKNLAFKRLAISQVNFLEGLFKSQPHFPGYIKIEFCRLTSLRPMQHLRSVRSSLYLHGNRLTSLGGLESLTTVGASLSLTSNKLHDISQLAKLEHIHGMLGLAKNQLVSLEGLGNLATLKTVRWGQEVRTLLLHQNPGLTDITALGNILTEDRYLTVFLDDPLQYRKRPALNSRFHQNILELHDAKRNRLIPTYSFVKKPAHDYGHFRKTTHNRLREYIIDLETEAEILVLSFTGMNGNLGGMFYNRFPLVTDAVRTHKVFVRDPQHLWYHGGITGITRNLHETIDLIQHIARAKAYRRVVCVGASMGGYMALLSGYLIGATDIVAFSPQTFIDSVNRARYGDQRWAKELGRLPTDIPPRYLDLAILYQESSKRPEKIQVFYGKRVTLDELHVRHLGKHVEVEVNAYDVDNHAISMHMAQQGDLNGIIQDLLREDGVAKAP